MRINKNEVKSFEWQQKEYGTKTALQNMIWSLCSNLLKDIGVRRVVTTYTSKGYRGKKSLGQINAETHYKAGSCTEHP